MSPDARKHLAALIARALHDAECGCGDYDPTAEDESPYSAQADAVMVLFPEVEVVRTGWVIPTGNYSSDGWAELATHVQFVLRTAPEPIEETP